MASQAHEILDSTLTQLRDIATDIERNFDEVSANFRERVLGQQRPPPRHPRLRLAPPPTTWQLAQRWMHQHKALTAAILAFVVTGSVGTFVYVQSRGRKRKRRARKAASGARTDVVVVMGAVANPLTSALYLDLERRGFVVYVVVNTGDDERFVRMQGRSDLMVLSLDLADGYMGREQLGRFEGLFGRNMVAFEQALPHRLNFVGLVVVPDTQYGQARVEDVSSEEWSDAFNATILNTIATTKLLLPAVIEHKAKVLLLTPSVTPVLSPPMHAVESTVYGALKGFASSLAAELKQDGVYMSHFKLGNIDIPALTTRQKRAGVPPPRLKPTPIRQLHRAVFDTLVSSRPRRTVYVGRGALAYDLIGSLVPPVFIAWMMGASERPPAVVRQASEEDMRGSAGSLTWEKVDQEE